MADFDDGFSSDEFPEENSQASGKPRARRLKTPTINLPHIVVPQAMAEEVAQEAPFEPSEELQNYTAATALARQARSEAKEADVLEVSQKKIQENKKSGAEKKKRLATTSKKNATTALQGGQKKKNISDKKNSQKKRGGQEKGVKKSAERRALEELDKYRHYGRRSLQKIIERESVPTTPMRIVDRLIGSPYANPRVQQNEEEQDARKTMEFGLDIAAALLRYGAAALEVETSTIAVLSAFGLEKVDVDITNQSVTLNYAREGQPPITLMTVVRSWTTNFNAILEIHQLVTDIISGALPRDKATERLGAITHQRKPFPRWATIAARGVYSAGLTLAIGGGAFSVLIAFLSNVIVGILVKIFFRRHNIPDFFVTMFSAFLVAGIAIFTSYIDAQGAIGGLHWEPIGLKTGAIITGGILFLLPVGQLVTAVQDAINGFQVTAAGKFLAGMLTLGALIGGVAFAVVLAGVARIPLGHILATGFKQETFWIISAVGLFIAVVMLSITEQTSYKMLMPTGIIGLIAFLVSYGIQQIGVGERVAPALAAIVVGFLARSVGLRMGAPQLLIAVPAVLPLMPGLMIFRAIYSFTILDPDNVAGAVTDIVSALIIILAIGAGVVLGDLLASSLTKGSAPLIRGNDASRRYAEDQKHYAKEDATPSSIESFSRFPSSEQTSATRSYVPQNGQDASYSEFPAPPHNAPVSSQTTNIWDGKTDQDE